MLFVLVIMTRLLVQYKSIFATTLDQIFSNSMFEVFGTVITDPSLGVCNAFQPLKILKIYQLVFEKLQRFEIFFDWRLYIYKFYWLYLVYVESASGHSRIATGLQISCFNAKSSAASIYSNLTSSFLTTQG